MPLGIKAVVVAVYEPPQESSRDSLRILPDSNDEVLDEVCESVAILDVFRPTERETQRLALLHILRCHDQNIASMR